MVLTESTYSLTNILDCTSDAGSVFILATAAPLATETVIIMSMEAALGVEITANPSAFLMGKRVRSGVSKRTRLNIWSNELCTRDDVDGHVRMQLLRYQVASGVQIY